MSYGLTSVSANTGQPDNIVLISWDGISKDTLRHLLEKESLPNLASILKNGSFVNISITDHYPDTMAGHAEILTGYPPEMTKVFKSMRYEEIPVGLTIFERLEETLGYDNVSTSIVASQEQSLGSMSGMPFFHAGKMVDYYYDRNSDAGLVGSVASESVFHFSKSQPFFIFIHFRDAADSGYAFGAGSNKQEESIIAVDMATGKILDAIKESGIADNTLIYVTTDHGFNTGPKDHTGQTNLWFIANEPGLNQTGDQKDIAPTVLKKMGVAYEEMVPAYPGKSLF